MFKYELVFNFFLIAVNALSAILLCRACNIFTLNVIKCCKILNLAKRQNACGYIPLSVTQISITGFLGAYKSALIAALLLYCPQGAAIEERRKRGEIAFSTAPKAQQ